MSRPAMTRERLFVPWLVFATLCSFLMWQLPGEETIPYHLAWIAIAVAYGIEAWPWAQTVAAVVVYTLVTGGILAVRAATDVLGWQETAEIPLMSALVLIVLWNVRRRRHLAYATLSELSARDRERAARRERLSRMTWPARDPHTGHDRDRLHRDAAEPRDRRVPTWRPVGDPGGARSAGARR